MPSGTRGIINLLKYLFCGTTCFWQGSSVILCHTQTCLDDVGKQTSSAHTCILSAITCGKLTKLAMGSIKKQYRDPESRLLGIRPCSSAIYFFFFLVPTFRLRFCAAQSPLCTRKENTFEEWLCVGVWHTLAPRTWRFLLLFPDSFLHFAHNRERIHPLSGGRPLRSCVSLCSPIACGWPDKLVWGDKLPRWEGDQEVKSLRSEGNNDATCFPSHCWACQ